MGKFWSLYSEFADWKRQWIVIALLVCLVGVVWEFNDLLQDNQGHPWLNPESSLSAMQFDEFGDPYAIAKPESLAYAKLWSNPLTRIAFVFMLTLIIGSLVRGLTRGLIALVALVVVTAFLFGQSSLFSLQLDPSQSLLHSLFGGLDAHSEALKSFVSINWQLVGTACVGLYFGIFR